MPTNGKAAIEDAVKQVVIAASAPSTEIKPRVVKPVPIELDGTKRSLRMDFRAMKVIQDKTGLVMWRGDAWNPDNIDPMSLSTIIWACMLHESPDLTLEEVQEMEGMQLSNFTYLTDRMGMLWGNDMPTATDDDSEASEDESTPPNVVQLPSTTG